MGKIHSIETMGLVDGPGIRTVVFFQGCQLRCAYCHNPDTWALNQGQELTAEQLVQKVLKYKSYFNTSGGGITCSGGEPLLQPDFLLEVLQRCRQTGIHTALDTAGVGWGNYQQILKHTDLVLLDIKHANATGFKALTGGNYQRFQAFADALNRSGVKVWLRHVLVPGITDQPQHLAELQQLIKQFHRVEKVQLLPYHTLGVNKYQAMGLDYPLQGLAPMCRQRTTQLEQQLNIQIKKGA